MTTIYDVPAEPFIRSLASELKVKYAKIKPLPWALYVKTGVFKERAPTDPDWWFVRCASILRKVALNTYIGVSRLRGLYGGRNRRGAKPEHVEKGSGSIVRHSLQQLEEEGLVETVKGRGRRITPKGQSLIDHLAHELKMKLQKEKPELVKY
ncbi:MAG: 30S ribosomal protein S19e [Candidatus Helarchaeota archaeon]|nr:30S ribosomal protein S19e [Candidatus Helarchaeota archaeon]